MKEVSHKKAYVRNPDTEEFEPLMAIRGENAYEIAVRLGKFTGTEEEWANFIEIERAAAVKSVEDKGAETLASIPDDYTALAEEVARLEADKIDKTSIAQELGNDPNKVLSQEVTTHELRQISEEIDDFEAEMGYSIPTTATDGMYVNYVDGQNRENERSSASGYIPICEGITYKLSNLDLTGGRSICVYDHNKIFKKFLVWGVDDTEWEYTTESGIYYIRATAKVGEKVVVKIKEAVKNSSAMRRITKAVYVHGALGDDDNDGFTAKTAFKSIQRAIDSGATNIFVVPMNYNSGITLTNKHNVTIEPYLIGAYSTDILDTPKIRIKGYSGNLLKNAVVMERCSNITFRHCWFSDCSEHIVMATNCLGLTMEDCFFSDNKVGAINYNGLKLYSTSGVFKNCLAYNIDSDGFNIHGYGNTCFLNCSAHDCGDDGISHHDGCTGLIDGGEWYNNAKGGVTSPTYGCNVDVVNVYAHDNKYGLYMPNDTNVRQMKSRVSNSVFINNTGNDVRVENVDVVAWNIKYRTLRKDGNATFNVIDSIDTSQ